MNRTILQLAATGCLLFSLNACASPPSNSPDGAARTNLGGQAIRLADVEGKCVVIKPDNKPLLTDLAWPCDFSRDRKGAVRVEIFKSVPIVLVVHNQPESAPGTDCQQTAQALRLRNGAFETSALNQGAMCLTGHDQKMFTAMFRW